MDRAMVGKMRMIFQGSAALPAGALAVFLLFGPQSKVHAGCSCWCQGRQTSQGGCDTCGCGETYSKQCECDTDGSGKWSQCKSCA
jgi:hypothetical protein